MILCFGIYRDFPKSYAVTVWLPRTPMTSIFEGQPPKTRPFPIKTRVIWVLGSDCSNANFPEKPRYSLLRRMAPLPGENLRTECVFFLGRWRVPGDRQRKCHAKVACKMFISLFRPECWSFQTKKLTMWRHGSIACHPITWHIIGLAVGFRTVPSWCHPQIPHGASQLEDESL